MRRSRDFDRISHRILVERDRTLPSHMRARSKVHTSIVIALCILVGCINPSSSVRGVVYPADLVFLGIHILTIDPATEGAQGVAVRGDTISAVGSRAEISRSIGPATRVVELGDRALLPGFIDAHGHLGLVMLLVDYLNVSSPPVGPMKSIEDIVVALRSRIDERRPAAGEFVIGYGYDDSLLAEERHPNRDDLDRVSATQPIVLLHVSAHLATANSAALAVIGYDAATPDPQGGSIRRRDGSREPNGVLEEAAVGPALASQANAMGSAEHFSAAVDRALAYYAGFGITTVQDGASHPAMVGGLRAVAAKSPLALDVAAYLREEAPKTGDEGARENAATDTAASAGPVAMASGGPEVASLGYSRDYRDGVRVAGVKFVLDGSPQGRTAWMTEPYREGPPGAAADYRAYPTLDPAYYRKRAAELIRAGVPFLAHANGDAAIDLMIEGVSSAVREIERGGEPVPDHRSVAIHAQLTRPDQLDAMKRLGIIPSFFAAHPFFWGDWHRKSFGDARALAISPLRSARARDLLFTIHNDAPVVPPDILRLVEIAVSRKTRSGFVLGENERITVEQALRAVTLDAAYGYFEEDRKGSITPGKRADLVVLATDPRAVAADEIGEISIVETIARGRTVHIAEKTSAD